MIAYAEIDVVLDPHFASVTLVATAPTINEALAYPDFAMLINSVSAN